MQEEDKAYMGTLLPTLAISLKMLKVLKESIDVKVCQPLVVAVWNGISSRFGPLFEDMDFLLAAALHPQFTLGWVRLLEDCVLYNVEEITAKVKKQVMIMMKILTDSRKEPSSSEG
ncbi:uncharacterized protein [Panulirus ornatus]|uniref:uncharacterized protein n=1 Tax=Panulirus ornatus TaxID=150431 RepID=UPI003A8AEE15